MPMIKYPKIRLLGSPENKGILHIGDELCIQEKIDGCFNYCMKVKTNNGMIPIGEIVNKRLDIKVLSVNKFNGNHEYKSVVKYYRHGRGNNWVKITYDYFGKIRYLIATDNHNVMIQGGIEKPIREIDIKTDLFVTDKLGLTNDAKQILIGSILGDGSFRNMNHKTKNPMYSETHGIKQEGYLKWKKNALKQLISNEDYFISQFNQQCPKTRKYRIYSISTPIFKQMDNFYVKGKKRIPNDISDVINPLGIAVWYMDDGSCSFSNKQKPRAKFHTQSFTKTEVKRLMSMLNDFGISSTCHNYNGWQMDVTTDGTEKLFKLISPYIIKIMQYKIPKEYRHNNIYTPSTESVQTNCKILSIEKYNPKSKQRYDLEIADNHNYFVKGILVHNSNFRFMTKNGKIYFGSHKREIGNEDANVEEKSQFKGCINYIIKTVNRDELKKFDKSYIFFGEVCIKHTINYKWDEMPFYLGFDVYDLNSKKFLPVYEAKDIFERIGLTFVPIKHTGLYTTKNSPVFDLIQQENWDSVYAEDGKAEGIVIKNVRKQIYAKKVDPRFKEKNREAFRKPKKYCESDNDLFISIYVTEPRIEKCIFKLIDDDHPLDRVMMKHLPMMVWKDIWEEEWGEIIYKKWTLNFGNLKKNMAKFCLTTLDRMIVNQSR